MKAVFRPLRMATWDGPTTPQWNRRSRSTFKAGWQDTMYLLGRELEYLGAKQLVIEADFREQDIRLDGLPRANARQPSFPGVRIAFDSTHGSLVYQADNCAFWQHNVRSVGLGLEALRAVDRYGITHRAEQYTGFRAIEAPSQGAFRTADDALQWLRSEEGCGFAGGMALSTAALLKHAARMHHPDRGGDPAKWEKLDQAKRLLTRAGMVA